MEQQEGREQDTAQLKRVFQSAPGKCNTERRARDQKHLWRWNMDLTRARLWYSRNVNFGIEVVDQNEEEEKRQRGEEHSKVRRAPK